jgi:hypothetical protein
MWKCPKIFRLLQERDSKILTVNMFALRLSFGWIDTYKKGVPSVPRPFLQVTEVVSVAAENLTKSGHIYRLSLFDGTHTTHALLHPSIEHLLVGLQNTVVKLLEFKNISLSSGLYVVFRLTTH